MKNLRVLLIGSEGDREERMRDALRTSPLARIRLDRVAQPADIRPQDGHEPDVVVIDAGHVIDGAHRALGEVRRTFAASALVLVGDRVALGPALTTQDESLDCIIASPDTDALDHVVVAAATLQQRLLALRRRVLDLEVDERNLRTLVSTTSDGIMIVDMDGTICFANPAAGRLFGREPADLVGVPFGFPLVAGDTITIDLVRRDGESCVAELRTSRTRWEGRPARLAALRDITERVLAEERERDLLAEHTRRVTAEQSERRTRLLSEATRLLAATLDGHRALNDLAGLVVPALADCCIVDTIGTDAAFQRVAVTGAGHAASLAPILRERTPNLAAGAPAHALQRGEPWTADCADPGFRAALGLTDDDDIQTPDARGTFIPLIARGETVGAMVLIRTGNDGQQNSDRYRDDNGADDSLAREIAQRAAIAIDHARLFSKAQEAAEAKADFLAVMSHELRTPLNAILGYAELLSLGVPAPLPDESVAQVDRIRASAGHLLRLINEILSYSSLEDGRADLDLEATDVAPLVRDVIDSLRPLADRRQVALSIDAPEADIQLETDPHRLRQILINIVSNAIKFTDEGGIIVRVRDENRQVVISVLDTGCGIAEADLQRIFLPFWQAEQSRTRRADGTGLGLAVARRLAHLLAGDITVESVPGDGSEFTLRLPARFPGTRRPRS